MKEENLKSTAKLHSFLVILSMIFGSLVGLFSPKWSAFFAPFGDLYFSFLESFVIPFIVMSIIVGIGKVLIGKKLRKEIGKVFFLILIGFFIFGFFGSGISLLSRVGKFNVKTQMEFGHYVFKEESQEKGEFSVEEKTFKRPDIEKKSFLSFFSQMLPSNVFESFSKGIIFPIVLFSIFLGIAVGFVSESVRGHLIRNLSTLGDAFDKVISWLRHAFPFGIFCAFAKQLSEEGQTVVASFFGFLSIYSIGILGVLAMNVWILSRVTQKSWIHSFLALKESMLVAFGSGNKFLAIPFAIKNLRDFYPCNKERLSLLLPLGLTMCSFGFIFTLSFCSVFLLQLYHIHVGFFDFFIILIGSIFVSVAVSAEEAGTPMALLASLPLIFEPLGFPVKPATILFVSFMPFFFPMIALLDLHTSCTIFSLVESKKWFHGKESQIKLGENPLER